jgi:putative flavoprotein involved in K+ transport
MKTMPTTTTASGSTTRVERFGTIVVGGGQAALAAGHHLADRDVDFVMLSDESRVGDNWRKRWDSLRLFTPARYSSLPGMPFPAAPHHLADKDEVADYLERYAERFDLPLRLATRAEAVAWNGEHFEVSVNGGASRLEADNVVVATGPFQRPRVPDVSTQLSQHIQQIHSSAYRNPFELPDGPVLVVGAGNSGAQIALEVARYRKTWLAGRDTGHVPRRILGRDVFDWAWPMMTRFTRETRLGRRLQERAGRGGDALIGIPEHQLSAAGVVRVGRVTEERGGMPVCDGEVIQPAVIIWCTGFRAAYSWIRLPVFDADGLPRHTRGVVTEVPGLYFLGLRFQHRMSSSLVGGVGADAAFIAERVAARSGVAITV